MLTFDAAEHKYYWGGEPMAGVTTVLKECGLTPPYPKTEAAAAKRDAGTKVHEVLALYDLGLIDETVVLALGAQGEQYLQFLADTKAQWLVVESAVVVTDPYLWFAGQLDRAGYIGDEFCVLDIKNTDGSPPEYTAIQTAAYLYGYEHMIQKDLSDAGGYALRLRSKGHYALTRLWRDKGEALYYRGLWVNCLNLYHWKHKTHKKKGIPPKCLHQPT